MFYLTTSHTLDGWGIEADWSYTVTPGYPATRTEPAEPPEVDSMFLEAIRIDGGKPFRDCPDWLAELISPSDDALIAHAAGRRACDRADAADYQRDMHMERVG